MGGLGFLGFCLYQTGVITKSTIDEAVAWVKNQLTPEEMRKPEISDVDKFTMPTTDEGFDEISKLFLGILEIEKHHSHRYEILAAQLRMKTFFSKNENIGKLCYMIFEVEENAKNGFSNGTTGSCENGRPCAFERRCCQYNGWNHVLLYDSRGGGNVK